MVLREHEHDIDQGDILNEVPFVERRGSGVFKIEMLGMVTSHGCTCEKYTRLRDSGEADDHFLETYTLHVTPLMAASRFDGNELGNIRSGRVRQYHALPASDVLPELVLDLNLEQPVPAILLLELKRRASLAEAFWDRFVIHRFVFQTRRDPRAALQSNEPS